MYDIDKFIKGFESEGISFFKVNAPNIIDDKNSIFLELYGFPNLRNC